MIPMSSSVVDAPRKDECLPMMEQLGGGGRRSGKERRGEEKGREGREAGSAATPWSTAGRTDSKNQGPSSFEGR